MAALLMHQALAMDVEAGVPPMKAIQAATLNVAKTFKKDKDYGSVEPGKVADFSIVEGDPLKDIWMTQNVKMVVMDGKVIDHGFTRYKNPIASFYSLPEPAARPANLAAVSDRGLRPDDVAGARRGRHVAVPSSHVERPAAADELRLQGRAQGDHCARGDSHRGHLHRHAEVRRRSVSRIPSRPSGSGIQTVAWIFEVKLRSVLVLPRPMNNRAAIRPAIKFAAEKIELTWLRSLITAQFSLPWWGRGGIAVV